MSKVKHALLTVLSMVLVAVIAVGATLAYLTDTDNDVNVMTVGNVQIEQIEQQRVEKDGEFTSELEDFEQGKILMPVTYPGDRTTDTVKIGDYEIEFSDKEANYVDKIVSVTNTGKSEAYVRTLVAVPTGGADWEPTPVSANNCWLHWNMLKGYDAHWTLNATPTLIEIDGEGYYVWEFVHKAALQSEKTTFPVIKGFYMDQKVNNDDNGFFMTYADGTTKRIEDVAIGDSVNVLVLSQAVQAAGFDDAETALDTAFGDITVEKAKEWFGDMSIPTAVSTADELKNAINGLKDGETLDIVLTENVTADAEFIVDAGTVTIDLNGKTLEVTDGSRAICADNDATLYLKNGTINAMDTNWLMGVFRDGKIYAENCTFNATYCFGMNGATTTAASVAEFTNCKFNITSGWNAVYVSAKGTYTFKDCVIEGGAGVLVRSGNVTLDGCTIIAHGYYGQGKPQTAFYANYKLDSETDVVKSGIAYWDKDGSEKSTGDCVAIIDNSGSGYDLKSVTIKNCTFEVKNSVNVDGNTVPAAYAVRYLNRGTEADTATLVFENNKDVNGNAIVNGEIGYVYSYYTCK